MTRSPLPALLPLLCLLAILTGCDRPDSTEGVATPGIHDGQRTGDPPDREERIPPSPPLAETFDARPQMSLFPRVGDYQPDAGSDRYPFWRTFIDHFTKVSGLKQQADGGNRAWSFRSINTIDSVAFFSPIAVEPSTAYRVSYRVEADLPDGARTGIGILEFSRFLWVGEQYTEQMTRDYLVGSSVGVEIRGKAEWEQREFILNTGPDTHMVHLVFFRDGEHSRDPVLIDDIEIRKAKEDVSDQ